jgi:hypothetical protein
MSCVDARDKGDGPQRFWAEFSHDPRLPENAPLRASDRDRDVVQRRLGEAYAGGRLDRDELDERTGRVQTARTLGQLPEVVRDLVPPEPSPSWSSFAARPDRGDLRARAERQFAADRYEAVLGMLIPSVVCVVIWAAFGHGFFWPGFVILGTLVRLVQTLVRREDIIEGHLRTLEKRQLRELELRDLERRKRERGHGPAPEQPEGS